MKKKMVINKNSNSEYLNGDELCLFLNIKMSFLRSLVFKNEIPVIRIGKVLRYSRTDIGEWMESKKHYSFEEKK